MTVAGTASLGGTLNVEWLGSSPPSLSNNDNYFVLLGYGSRTNDFAYYMLPTFSDRQFERRFDDPLAPHALSLWVDSL